MTISDFNNIGVCRVASDFRPGMEELFQLLTANGFTRISFCDFPQYQVKYEAYRICAARFGVAAERFDLTTLAGEELDKMVDTMIHSRTEAVILASDYLATLFIPRFVRAGVRVPEDLSVISIDGTGWSQHYNPPLTSVRQDIPAIAEAALEILFDRIKGNCDIITSLIPTKLNIFQSAKLTTGEES
ncbi:HTH-type transcriptional repressor PurR [bioreactor metagenome]|uniref:HTH-type transcriptional repressor PurR n=1 Tax=bioreactor metagenome TaxID=1076179 RepID=A0A645FSW7_9ZZZZ